MEKRFKKTEKKRKTGLALWKKTGCVLLSLAVAVTVLFCAAGTAAAAAKVDDGTFEGSSPAAYYSGSSGGLFKKITFSGGKVTFQGKVKVKVNGKKKTLKKVTLPLSGSCKYYEGWDDGLHAAKKSKMQKYLKKGQFISLFVTVKGGKVVQFVNGA